MERHSGRYPRRFRNQPGRILMAPSLSRFVLVFVLRGAPRDFPVFVEACLLGQHGAGPSERTSPGDGTTCGGAVMRVEQRNRRREAPKDVPFQARGRRRRETDGMPSEEGMVGLCDHLGARTTPGALEEAWSLRRGSRRWWQGHSSCYTFLSSSLCPQRWHRTCSRARRRYHVDTAAVNPMGLASLVGNLLVLVLLTSLGDIPVTTAETCTANVVVSVSSNTNNLTRMFDCEGGNFSVQWTGSVTVTESIKIGSGTTVSIFGTYDNGLSASDLDDGGSSATQSEGGSAVIAGTKFGPIFVAVGASLHLEKMALRQGFAQNMSSHAYMSGGGINADSSNVTFVGCEIEDMFADFWGGGIFANESRVIVQDTVFRNCSAGKSPEPEDSDPDGAGGGIGVWRGDLLVDNCYFEGCYASKKGGAIQHTMGRATVSKSSFNGNSAGRENTDDAQEAIGEGADVSTNDCYGEFDGDNGACLVNDNHFQGSRTGNKGAVIQIGGGDDPMRLEVNRCVMLSASCGKDFDDDPQGEGGVISIGSNVEVTLRDSVVNDSTVGKKGGAIVLASSDSWDSPGGTLVMVNSTFSYCEAQRDTGGVIYLNEYSTLNITGDSNIFLRNKCEENGAVVSATVNTRVNIEGGLFYENEAGEGGAVISSSGEVSISGGTFRDNLADTQGGVWVIKTEDDGPAAVMVVDGGLFANNTAEVGGVGFIDEEAEFVVSGGKFTGNFADNGGVFAVEEDATFEVTGGTFVKNEASFGGFLYKNGRGTCSCSGSTIEGHVALDGGAVYAFDDAVLDWECNLVGNNALSGPAFYARDDAEITMNGVQVVNNTISRGSIIFLVESKLWTYKVDFIDSVGYADLSAVQADEDSWFIAEETAFIGFSGEAVVYSQGKLFLDACDFSESPAEVLVDSAKDATVRNALLGNRAIALVFDHDEDDPSVDSVRLFIGNGSLGKIVDKWKLLGETYEKKVWSDLDVISSSSSSSSLSSSSKSLENESPAQEASNADVVPNVDSLITSHETCEDSGICSGTRCLDGDLGVYCECFLAENSGDEICLSTQTTLALSKMGSLEPTYYPGLIEGQLLLSSDSNDSGSSFSNEAEGVMWNASVIAETSAGINWTVFPDTGIIRPGSSIILYVVGEAGDGFDGTTNVSFAVDATGSSTSEDDEAGSETATTAAWSTTLEETVSVRFYHCEKGNFWNVNKSRCDICADGDYDWNPDGLNCASPGASTFNLPLFEGYWRASNTTLFVRECLNEDACVGGSIVADSNGYCNEGYEGPYCAVCSSNYGRGVGNICYKCTASLQAGMIFLVSLGCLLTVVVVGFLAIYLVGGKDAVAESVSKLRRRASSSSDSLGASISRVAKATSVDGKGAPVLSRAGESTDAPASRFMTLTNFRSTQGASAPRRRVLGLDRASVGGVTDFSALLVKNERGGKSDGVEGKAELQEHSKDMLARRGSHSEASTWEIFNPGEGGEGIADGEAEPKEGDDVPDGDALPEAASVSEETEAKVKDAADGGMDTSYRSYNASLGGVAVAARVSQWEEEDAVKRREEHHRIYFNGGDEKGAARSMARFPTHAGQGRPSVVSDGAGKGAAMTESKTNVGQPQETKSASVIIGEFLSKLPLSKLKIVIVVWQITSAFAQITQVTYPPIYEDFLETIGLFSFDLGWVLSASCLATKITFYDKLLIITIGPVVVLGFVCLTFYFGWERHSSGRERRTYPSSDVSETMVRDGPKMRDIRNGVAVSGGDFEDNEANGVSQGQGRSEVGGGGESTEDRVASRPTLERSSSSWALRPGRSRTALGMGGSQHSFRGLLKTKQGDMDEEEHRLWNLFARHTTMTLIVLYLVYSSVSTVVFQTFSCKYLEELDKSYLWADFRIECYTPLHRRYMAYAAVMIAIYPFGIPAAFWYFLNRQRSRINPAVGTSENEIGGVEYILEKKMEERKNDESVAPTAFLWSAYLPHRYLYEVFECLRRLLLTGLLVFILPDSPAQVALGCVFAFISLLAFELLRPHTDELDVQLYRTGCLVIFFSNFLALLLESDVATPSANSSAVFAVILIMVQVLLFLSIFWNTYASLKVLFSPKHVQANLIGVDIVGEKDMEEIMPPKKGESKTDADFGFDFSFFRWAWWNKEKSEAKFPEEELEAAPAWERDLSADVGRIPPQVSSASLMPGRAISAAASRQSGSSSSGKRVDSRSRSEDSALSGLRSTSVTTQRVHRNVPSWSTMSGASRASAASGASGAPPNGSGYQQTRLIRPGFPRRDGAS